ncbi:hypothetical protein CF134_02610 [Aeromonas salmonicida]|uniref:Uncharacterized protein n=3 Tax=Gammaproteobacteria TaxID=1236 RepID=A0A3L0W6M0_ECOLX|nr:MULTISPECIES: hypothetical protein [Aeromonas]MBP6384626.1 hypothetical protein [Aeromonas sp.]ATP08719.1 uncharacterized protein Asalp_15130 [Aeromonas salmonicida subsp. pectinolytica 34mel]EQC06394.1 hypothetical protein K931_01335 [Aeromonas salmonicida subsp. pectinolytica 34mel]KTA80808.1 hypothetical protein VO69_13165 [Aeromonas salmonicida]MBP8223062.1 hypothetical protein [Aeromonas sp.]
MRFISTKSGSTQAHPLLSKLGRGLLPLWLRGKPSQHHYRLQIRCQDRADMEQVLDMVSHTLQPAGLHPMQSLRPGRSGGRELVLNLHCTPPQRRYLVQFVHQVGVAHPVRWELRPRRDAEPVLN